MKHNTIQTKEVRIDHKTVIVVNIDIPDDNARANFLRKRQENERLHNTKADRTRNSIQKSIEL